MQLIVTEIHSDCEAYVSRVVDVNETGVVLERSPARTPVGRHVWLELALPSAPDRQIRILAEICGRGPEVTRHAFKHVWPADRDLWCGFVTHALAA